MKIRAVTAMAALVCGALLAGACSLVVGLDDIKLKGQGGGGGSLPCNVDGQCDDHNACTKDSCGPDKACVFDGLDGVDSPTQTAGDCLTVACVKGEPVSKPDDTDFPDDNKDCTVDACSMGVASHVAKALGTACTEMGNAGTCDALGNCTVACLKDADCATTNPCVTPSCDGAKGVCDYPDLQDGTPTPGVAPIAGDCKVSVCVGGVATLQNDNSDVPVTATDCDTEVCTKGVPSNPPLAFEAPCSTFMGTLKGFCDHASPSPACRQCVADGDCPGPIDDCEHPACVNFACTTGLTPSGMPAAGTSNPPQVAGDCQRLVCDGNGGTMATYDSTDPASDGNQCTTDACTAPNQTTHVNVANGVHCGVGGTLACLNGTCAGCTTNAMCAPASCLGTVLTKSQTCNGSGACVGTPPQDCAPYLCSAGTDACTTKCNNVDTDCSQGGVGNYCSGANGACLPKLAQGAACAAGNHQCQSGNCVDGVCCNTACSGTCLACTAAKTGGVDGVCTAITTGTDPDAECTDQGAVTCGTTGVCANGACALYPNGTTCVAASCASGTLTKARTCNGSGTCTTPAPPTQACAPYLCSGNACTSSCVMDTDCAAGDFCSGGVCGTKLSAGAACGASNQCTSGFCVDGVCCTTACNTACQACSAAKKQSGVISGACGNAKNGVADPRALCGTSPPCGNDGLCSAGACEKTASGTGCAAATCVGSTLTTARTCDGMGTCQLGFASMCMSGLVCNAATMACYAACGSDDSKCVSGDYCDGVAAGACQTKLPTGSACASNHMCASNICTANVCQ